MREREREGNIDGEVSKQKEAEKIFGPGVIVSVVMNVIHDHLRNMQWSCRVLPGKVSALTIEPKSRESL